MVIRNGDSSFANFVANRKELVDYVTRIIGSRADAEDIVQDAFIRFLPSRNRHSQSTRSYLFKIARNLAIDLYRRRKLEARQTSEHSPHWMRPGSVDSPEHQVIFQDDLRKISRYLDNCTDEVRMIVVMYRLRGDTMESIAKELEISVSKVHRTLRKSMADISELMDKSE